MTIKLGDKVRDQYTGFEGFVFGITDWLYGCRRLTVVPAALDKDGQPGKAVAFDEPQCVLVEAREPFRAEGSTSAPGGPYPDVDRGR